MRSKYSISNYEMLNELRTLQEALINLIGYDSNAFDDSLDKEGSIDTTEDTVDSSGLLLMNNSVYGLTPLYASFYEKNLISYVARRSVND